MRKWGRGLPHPLSFSENKTRDCPVSQRGPAFKVSPPSTRVPHLTMQKEKMPASLQTLPIIEQRSIPKLLPKELSIINGL